MNFDFLLSSGNFDKKLAKKYGFTQKSDCFYLNKPINDDFIAKVCVKQNHLDINLFDVNFNTDYEMLNIENLQSGFVLELRSKVTHLANEIVANCFVFDNTKQFVIDYIKQKYGVLPEYPWEDYPNCCTFKNPKQKWFAIIMDITADKLGLKHNNMVDVLNLKAAPNFVKKIIDNKNIFAAYHMNKIHWFTVLLNSQISKQKLKELIDLSYNCVTK